MVAAARWRPRVSRRSLVISVVVLAVLGGLFATGRLTLNPQWDRELDLQATDVDACSFLTAAEFDDAWNYGRKITAGQDPPLELRVTPFPKDHSCVYSVARAKAPADQPFDLGRPSVVVRPAGVGKLDWATYQRYWGGTSSDYIGVFEGLDQVYRMGNDGNAHVVDLHRNGFVVEFRFENTTSLQEFALTKETSGRIVKAAGNG